MLGEFQKIQEICSKMGTKIFKIDGEMPKIIEHKVGNPQISISRKWANLSQPWNLTFYAKKLLSFLKRGRAESGKDIKTRKQYVVLLVTVRWLNMRYMYMVNCHDIGWYNYLMTNVRKCLTKESCSSAGNNTSFCSLGQSMVKRSLD